MKIQDFINGKVTYDKFGGQYFWINEPQGGTQMLAELRGWGHIQNMFKDKKGNIDSDEAGKYQDEIGDWIAEAINEKLKREADGELNPAPVPAIELPSDTELAKEFFKWCAKRNMVMFMDTCLDVVRWFRSQLTTKK